MTLAQLHSPEESPHTVKEMQRADWLQWRKDKLGASDSPILLNQSPFKTPYQLWCEKTGLSDSSSFENQATSRGQNLEAIAREHYELQSGLTMKPIVMVHAKFDFIIASLDGYNREERIVLEIKVPGKAAHDLAKAGKIPDYYYPQLQHQLMVSGAKLVHYYSFDGVDGILVEVQRDESYIQETLLPALLNFKKLIDTKVPPPLTDRDYKTSNDKELRGLIEVYAKRKAEIDGLTKEAEMLKEKIFSLCDHPRISCGDVKILTGYRSGGIDYSKIPQLEGVDLEPYRKPPQTFRSILLQKK